MKRNSSVMTAATAAPKATAADRVRSTEGKTGAGHMRRGLLRRPSRQHCSFIEAPKLFQIVSAARSRNEI